MFEIQGLYAPHIGMQASLHLWRKLADVHKQRKNVLFLGIESANTHRSQEQWQQEIYRQDRAHMQRQLGIGRVQVHQIKIGPDALIKFGETLGPIPEDPQEQHGLFTHVVAGLHDLPLHVVEYADRKRVKKTRRLYRAYRVAEDRLFQLVAQQASVDNVLRQARRYYFDSTDMNISRHKGVVKNLQRLFQKQEYKPGGLVVLQFGAFHVGLEKYLEKELKRKGISVRALKPERHGIAPTIWEELLEERTANPRFKPSDEQVARGLLHFLIGSANPENPTLIARCEGIIRKMPLDKVKEALTHMVQQDAPALTALLSPSRNPRR